MSVMKRALVASLVTALATGLVTGAVLGLLSLTASTAERREEALKSLVTERVDIAADDIVSGKTWTTLGYVGFCTAVTDPQPLAGWAVEPLDSGCYEVMSVETAKRIAEMERDQREYKALAPVRYILGDDYRTLAKAEGRSGVYVAVLPAYEANRLMRDPEFTMRARDAGLTPVLIDRYAFDQPMLGIVFDLTEAEAGE